VRSRRRSKVVISLEGRAMVTASEVGMAVRRRVGSWSRFFIAFFVLLGWMQERKQGRARRNK
jgi:hypothetical protein